MQATPGVIALFLGCILTGCGIRGDVEPAVPTAAIPTLPTYPTERPSHPAPMPEIITPSPEPRISLWFEAHMVTNAEMLLLVDRLHIQFDRKYYHVTALYMTDVEQLFYRESVGWEHDKFAWVSDTIAIRYREEYDL